MGGLVRRAAVQRKAKGGNGEGLAAQYSLGGGKEKALSWLTRSSKRRKGSD